MTFNNSFSLSARSTAQRRPVSTSGSTRRLHAGCCVSNMQLLDKSHLNNYYAPENLLKLLAQDAGGL